MFICVMFFPSESKLQNEKNPVPQRRKAGTIRIEPVCVSVSDRKGFEPLVHCVVNVISLS